MRLPDVVAPGWFGGVFFLEHTCERLRVFWRFVFLFFSLLTGEGGGWAQDWSRV